MKIATLLTPGLLAAGLLCVGFAQDPVSEAERAFAAARALSPTPLRIDREHAEWRAEREVEETRADTDARWIQHWTASAARDAAVRALSISADDLSRGCVDIGISGCETFAGGYLNIRGDRLMWQIQDGYTDEDGRGAGYVFLSGSDRLHPIAWGREGIFYEAPRLFWHEDQAYVWAPGGMAGTGAFNADALFRFTPGAATPLAEIDVLSWRDLDLPALLPPGLEIWKGVGYHREMLGARTSLWRPDDGNCCPTGGEATLMFDIRGDRLVLTELIPDAPGN